MCGFWADFINPFSGQPYHNQLKNSSLYKTDERFRCVGFKVEQKTNCKIIEHDNKEKDFIGKILFFEFIIIKYLEKLHIFFFILCFRKSIHNCSL